MLSKFILDTNFVLRLLVKDDERQLKEVMSFVDKCLAKNYQMYIDKSIFFELCFVLTGKIYQLTKVEFRTKIEELVDLNCFEFEDLSNILSALKLYSENNLDIVDCYLIAKARGENFEFKSFDKKANQAYQKLINS